MTSSATTAHTTSTGTVSPQATTSDDTPTSDPINRLLQWLGLNGLPKSTLDHNRYLSLSMVLSAVLTIWSQVFPPKVPSPFCCNQMVTESELQAQFDNYKQQQLLKIQHLQEEVTEKQKEVQIAITEIQQENAELASVIKQVAAIAMAAAPVTGPIGPLIGVVATLLTAGLAADNARKTSLATLTSNETPSTKT